MIQATKYQSWSSGGTAWGSMPGERSTEGPADYSSQEKVSRYFEEKRSDVERAAQNISIRMATSFETVDIGVPETSELLEALWPERHEYPRDVSEHMMTVMAVLLDHMNAAAFSSLSDTLDAVSETTVAVHPLREVFRLLEQEPIEDGIRHPAEEVLASRLEDSYTETVNAIRDVLDRRDECTVPASPADLVKCLGRLPFEKFGTELRGVIEIALNNENVEVRDAAVQAVENWEAEEMVPLLKQRLRWEPVPWLREYIEGVSDDLSRRG